MKRPELKIGDLVKYSKKMRSLYDSSRDAKFVVDDIQGDGAEKHSIILCIDRLGRPVQFERYQLWKTGFNIVDKKESSMTVKKQEEECKTCHKMKDLGRSCWWCGC